jgi:RND family efflux transporter MFP subunit
MSKPRVRKASAAFHRTALAAVSVIAIAMPMGCGRSSALEAEKSPPATVKWEEPLKGALEEWTELVGTTSPSPDRVARVTAPIEGRVLSILGDSASPPVVEGQRVEKGTAIVQLDPTIVEASLAKAEAAQNVLREEEKQAQIALNLAAAEVERLRQLKMEEDKSPPGSRVLVSAVDRLKADAAFLDAQSKLGGAKAKLISGGKDLEALQAQLKLHTLAAPIAGRVGRIQVVRGQTLSVGTIVAEVVDLDQQIDVLCFVPPSMVGRLKVGQPALSGGFDQDPSTTSADGEIVFIADQAEPETGNFAVKVRFSNQQAHLRANHVLRIRVLTSPGKECLSVPEAAIQEDEERPSVVIVVDVKITTNPDGQEQKVGIARRLNVVLGVRDRTLHQIEIIRLEDPEKDPAKKWQGDVKDVLIVVHGGHGLQTGDAVKFEADED